MRPIVLHVGYHKTATTYLQRTVFPAHPEILYLGKPWATPELKRLVLEWQFAPSLQLDPDVYRTSFAMQIDKLAADSSRLPLISQESLHSGPNWDGGHVPEMARRIRATFPQARILLTIRNQTSLIESLYKHYVYLGGTLPFEKYLHESVHARCGLLAKLEYDRVIALYRSLFGSEHVGVMLHEDLNARLEEALSGLQHFIGLVQPFDAMRSRVNVSAGPRSTAVIRRINLLLARDFEQQYYQAAAARPSGPADRLRRALARQALKLPRGRGSILRAEDRRFIRRHFAASNARLADQLGRDLAELGYAVEEPRSASVAA